MTLVVDAPDRQVFGIRYDYVIVFDYAGHVVRRLTDLTSPRMAAMGPGHRLYVLRNKQIDVLDPKNLNVAKRIPAPNGRDFGTTFAFGDGRIWAVSSLSGPTHSNLISTDINHPGSWNTALKNINPTTLESGGPHSRYLHSASGAYKLEGTRASAIPTPPGRTFYRGHAVEQTGYDVESANGQIARVASISVGDNYQSGVELEHVATPGVARNIRLSPIGEINTVGISPSGRWLLTSAGHTIAIQRWNNRNDVRLINCPPVTYFTTGPVISPDGTTLFYAAVQPNGHSGFDLYFHRYNVDIRDW